MSMKWQSLFGLVVAIGIVGCVADEDNDAIKSAKASGATTRVKAPEVTFKGYDGSSISMSQLAGKVVFIDFWGPTCMACRTTLPFTQRLSTTFQSKDLVVLAVTREPRDSVKQFEQTDRYSFPTFVDDGTIFKAFNAEAMPDTVIIDRTGHIVGNNIGPQGEEDTIKQLAAAGLDVSNFHSAIDAAPDGWPS